MKLMDNETVVEKYTSYNTELILTTHRIRQSTFISRNESTTTSLMLEKITSCKFTKQENPLLFITAMIFFFVGIMGIREYTPYATMLLIAGGIILWQFYNSKSQGFKISTPSAYIWIKTKGKNTESAEDFIDKIEAAIFAIK